MRDITNARLLYAKALLLLVVGTLAAALLILERPTLKTAVLLAVAVWAFARCYYFAFYVVERYADPAYRFSGLASFARHVWRRKVHRQRGRPQSE